MDWVALRSKVTQVAGKYRYALLVLAVGLALMLIPAGRQEEAAPAAPTTAAEQPESVSRELSDILSQIQGAGEVRVMLTEATGEKTHYQTNTDISDSVSRIDTVIVTDSDRNESGLIRQVDPPTYLGAIVVCQGADRAAVRLAIVEAVSMVTGLGADQISVLKMK